MRTADNVSRYHLVPVIYLYNTNNTNILLRTRVRALRFTSADRARWLRPRCIFHVDVKMLT